MNIPGRFCPGYLNSITDVPNVTASHVTLIDSSTARTGLTLISPTETDIFQNPIPAAVAVGNGFGKLAGAMQIEELGELESLMALTNTLSVSAVMQGLIEHHAPELPKDYNSINVLVGETNDSRLNDIRALHVKPYHVKQAIGLLSKDVAEGAVGAGAGTVCFGFKGGIGTSSRVITKDITNETNDYTIGALVQSNYGGNLTVYGYKIPKSIPKLSQDGSCMIIILTDAPLSSRQLKRLAKRGLIGMTNTGSYMGHGSGDFAIAASNNTKNRRNRESCGREYYYLADSQLNPFFEACADAVQEALYNSMTMAAGAEYAGNIYPNFNPADYADILPLI